jgi:hypothetical protein
MVKGKILKQLQKKQTGIKEAGETTIPGFFLL